MPVRRKELKIEGPDLWYLVGLITTDGSLSIDGRHIDITSKDYSFLQEIKNSTGIKSKIGAKYGGNKQKYFRIQIANRNFYNFLQSIGLMPNKTLIVGAIKVPNQFFCDFLRGVIDGDGNIRRWLHTHNNGEQWSLRIYSPSETFIKWLKDKVEDIFRVKGRIHLDKKSPRYSDMFVLKYGKVAARVILDKCYYRDALSSERKAKLAEECSLSRMGWRQSKIILN